MRGERVLYYGKKLLIFIISVWVLSLVTFYVSRLAPGDPLISYYGERVEKMSPEEREWAEEKLGLNDKISVDGSDRHFMGILEFHINIKWMFWRYSKAESAIHWSSVALAF